MTTSNRDRFLSVARFQRSRELYLGTFFHDFWRETLHAWVEQGAPSALMDSRFRASYLGLDHTRMLREVVSGLVQVPAGLGSKEAYYPIPPLVPQFEQRILQEEEKTITIVNAGGQKVKVFRQDPQKMPLYLEYPVKDRDTWREYKKRLDPEAPGRYPAAWDHYVQRINQMDTPVCLMPGGFFGFLREWMGVEKLLYTFYDDPALIEEMMDQLLYLETAVVEKVTRDIRVDWVLFWEDMAYKSGSFISPGMFRRFMSPRYRKLADLIRSRGIDVLIVDSDGNVEELIPLFLECGVNGHWPLEVASGMDAVALRKKYGKDVILAGNIDKRVFPKGKEAIRGEVMAKVPFLMEKGGYFPSLDHLIPPDVTLENYVYFLNTMREIAGLEPRSAP
jgi:uroporphyrinogen-III decarboxylase